MTAVVDPVGHNCRVNISAKADYAMRALLLLATDETGKPVKGQTLASSQGIPLKFLENILLELRNAGIVASQRGAVGGYWLALKPNTVTIADVIRAVDGPLAHVRGLRPETTSYEGAAEHLQEVWIAVRASLRSVLEKVTLADVASGKLPRVIERLNADPDAWVAH
jgi:Rrf2 family protein